MILIKEDRSLREIYFYFAGLIKMTHFEKHAGLMNAKYTLLSNNDHLSGKNLQQCTCIALAGGTTDLLCHLMLKKTRA